MRARLRRLVRVTTATVSVVVLVATGYGWSQYHSLDAGIRRSGRLDDLAAPVGATQNILIMGLDSRLDENGDPLPAQDYAAMDTGGADVGGYNANVLMLVHIPGDGSRATVMSIPRDDYVDLAGAPDGQDRGKIKQAYGLAFDQEHKALAAQNVTDKTTLEQRSRDAGRNAEIATVSRFLGGVPIDHFVEVTLVAFYEIAQVVQPITVCVKENTRDAYSGADFHQGYQQISAAQAVAFVRQRRDYAHPQLNFTDLDRERRQQAFIASLAYQLKQAGTLTDPATLSGLIAVAQQNTALDPGLDLLALAGQATALSSGNVTFTTLPIEHFGTDPTGQDVNIVDLPTVRATVAALLDPAAAPAAPAAVPDRTVDTFNGSRRTGLAADVARDVSARGYREGVTANTTARTSSVVQYPVDDRQGAIALAGLLGIADTAPDSAVRAGHLRVVLGTTFSMPAALGDTTAPTTTSAVAPSPTDAISGGAIPCVK